MHNFKNLDVWKKSIQLCEEIYLSTKMFPDHEKYGITSQIRRCAVSISSNIAEGSSRNSDKDFIRFLEISLGSAFELETQLIIAKNIGFITEDKFLSINELLNEVQRKLFKLIAAKKTTFFESKS